MDLVNFMLTCVFLYLFFRVLGECALVYLSAAHNLAGTISDIKSRVSAFCLIGSALTYVRL